MRDVRTRDNGLRDAPKAGAQSAGLDGRAAGPGEGAARPAEHTAERAEHAAGPAEHAAGPAEHAAGRAEHAAGPAEPVARLGKHAARLRAALGSRPKIRLGHFPTPLTRLRNIERDLGRDHLYLKRDDLTGVSLGGNKVRGLEYLLGEALSRGADAVITGGGLQSNLCSLTAAACAKAGLRCVLVHNDMRPERGALAGNMLLNRIFDAEEVFLGPVSEEERAVAMEQVAAELRSQGTIPYVIHNGASTPVGALGYVEAALELLTQSEAMKLHLENVAIVGAMGGTAAGLVFGAAALGAPFHVHVISVEYSEEELRRRIADLTDGIEDVLGLRPPVTVEEVMTIHDRYLGEGYGVPTQESRETAHLLAIMEGIILENVYTSKTLAGFLDLVVPGAVSQASASVDIGVLGTAGSACLEGPAVCFHTGGMGALFAQAHL